MQHSRICSSCSTYGIEIDGFTDRQNVRFRELTDKAWQRACTRHNTRDLAFCEWVDAELDSIGHSRAASSVKGFDEIMAHFAVLALDRYWIDRTAEAAEIRMRWQIDRFLWDLDHLTKTHHDWNYICGIWKQSQSLPADIDDAPAEQLRLALAMLDTHIRRLCKDYDIRPMELPSRAHPHADRPQVIREDNNHLHIGHELEHCPPITAPDLVPF